MYLRCNFRVPTFKCSAPCCFVPEDVQYPTTMPFWRSTCWFQSFRTSALGEYSARKYSARDVCCPRRAWLVLLAMGACSAPDGSDLFTPLELVDNGAAGTGSFGGSGAEPPAPIVSAAGRGGSINEGLGGSSLSFAGAGGGAGDGSGSGGSSGSGGVGSGGLDAGVSEPPADAEAEPDAATDPPDPPDPPLCEPDTEVCDGLDNDCDEQADEAATCPAPCDGFVIGEGSYMFCAENVTRAVALNRCAAEGMRLAWLETPEENEAVRQSILASDVNLPVGELLTQIGASDAADEGEWFWVGNTVAPNGFQFWEGSTADNGGEVVNDSYANWDDTEPNNSPNEDCGAISVRGTGTRNPGEWDDRSCTQTSPYVCETP